MQDKIIYPKSVVVHEGEVIWVNNNLGNKNKIRIKNKIKEYCKELLDDDKYLDFLSEYGVLRPFLYLIIGSITKLNVNSIRLNEIDSYQQLIMHTRTLDSQEFYTKIEEIHNISLFDDDYINDLFAMLQNDNEFVNVYTKIKEKFNVDNDFYPIDKI